MPRHFKVHELLSREKLDALEAFTREPGRTIDEIETWLLAAGFNVSRGAVHAWRADFLQNDRYRTSADLARSFMEVASGKDVSAISDAGLLKLSQIVFEASTQLQDREALDSKEVCNLSAALKNVITSKRHLEKLQEEIAERQKLAASEAEKVAKAGGSAESVVAKVREILGIAA